MTSPNRKSPIAAEIPIELQDADQLLNHYGRWAMDRYKKQHCASAEGRYQPPPNAFDREPREIILAAPDALICQRALVAVPELERVVLQILYIPKRLPAQAQLRRLNIPPELSVARHLNGLRIFASRHRAECAKVERANGGLRRFIAHSRIAEAIGKSLDEIA